MKNPSYEFNILDYGYDIPRDKLEDARSEIREYLMETILQHISQSKSPVSGWGKFKPLDPKSPYKKHKKEEAGNTKANLELTGEMLDALDIKIKGNNLRLLIDDPDQAGKSDGHNNFSGKSKLPLRRFIPKGRQGFTDDIESGIRDIAASFE